MLLFQIFFISKMNISVLNNTNRKKRILNVFFHIHLLLPGMISKQECFSLCVFFFIVCEWMFKWYLHDKRFFLFGHLNLSSDLHE